MIKEMLNDNEFMNWVKEHWPTSYNIQPEGFLPYYETYLYSKGA